MKQEKYERKVTPGFQTVSMTRPEVIELVFAHAFSRRPTKKEMERLSLDVTNDGRGFREEWNMMLTLTNEDES